SSRNVKTEIPITTTTDVPTRRTMYPVIGRAPLRIPLTCGGWSGSITAGQRRPRRGRVCYQGGTYLPIPRAARGQIHRAGQRGLTCSTSGSQREVIPA